MTEEEKLERYNELEDGLETIRENLDKLVIKARDDGSIAVEVQDSLRGERDRVEALLRVLWPLIGPVCAGCEYPLYGEDGPEHADCAERGEEFRRVLADPRS